MFKLGTQTKLQYFGKGNLFAHKKELNIPYTCIQYPYINIMENLKLYLQSLECYYLF